ncbi:MAG: class aminotransferase [Acidimicrobiales bacterium]|nr:class aminotransferase [Acidimicrobiales bacterium]
MSATPLPRDQFPVADRYQYLDHARVAAPPTVVAHALARDASAATMLGSTSLAARAARVEGVREACASLLGSSADDITFVRNTTEGLGLVANGLSWLPRDEVLVIEGDHPLTVGPWAALADQGVALRVVASDRPTGAVPLERIAAALDAAAGGVRVLALAWVHHATGWRHDLAAVAALAHAHGAVLVADVIQGAGVLPTSLADWGVDAAVAGGQKWLLGPEGIGVLHTDPALRRRLRVATPGWSSFVEGPGHRFRTDVDRDPTGRRFEGGTRATGAAVGLGASVDLLAGAGIEAVWAHVDAWCEALVAGLDDLGATVVSDRSLARRSAIVAARFDGVDADVLVDRLISHGVVASAKAGAVRFSPHGWNDHDDLAATLRALHRATGR